MQLVALEDLGLLARGLDARRYVTYHFTPAGELLADRAFAKRQAQEPA